MLNSGHHDSLGTGSRRVILVCPNPDCQATGNMISLRHGLTIGLDAHVAGWPGPARQIRGKSESIRLARNLDHRDSDFNVVVVVVVGTVVCV